MVSMGPYTQAFDMRHMYDFVDLRKKNPTKCSFDDNSLLGILHNTPDFSIFLSLVDKAQVAGKLSQEQADYTLFVPSDAELRKKYSDNYLKNIDKGTATQIIAFSTMNRKIDKKLLQSSPVSTFPTTNRSNTLSVSTVSGITMLQNTIQVIHWNHLADNGLIHVIDDFLIPYQTIY